MTSGSSRLITDASALANLDRAVANNPENIEAHALRAEVLRLQADDLTDEGERMPLYEQMIVSLDRVAALAPENQEAFVTRQNAWAKEMNAGGAFLRRAGEDPAQAERAVGAFENAVVIQPDSSGSHFNLGLAYLVKGDTDASVGPLRQAVSMGEASAEAYRYLGAALLRTGDGASEAVTILEEGVERHPEDEALRAELLNAYATTNQPDRAVSAYEGLIASSPDDPLIRYNYGSTLLQLERYDEAIVQLERAVELDPSYTNAHYNLGTAYLKEGYRINERLSDESISDAEAQQIREDRDGYFEQAVVPLEQARRQTEAAGESAADVCNALLQAYTPLGRIEDANEAGECAGMDMN